MVVDGSTTTEADVVRLRAQLDQVGGHLLGCVLNNLDPKAVARYGSYYSAAYRYGGAQRSAGRRKEDREREDWGHHGTFPRGATEVNVSLGPAPFAGFDENPNGNGPLHPPESTMPPVPPPPEVVEEPATAATPEATLEQTVEQAMERTSEPESEPRLGR